MLFAMSFMLRLFSFVILGLYLNYFCTIVNLLPKCTASDAAEAALEKEFLEGIDKGTEVKHKYSVVMYGVPAKIEDEVELSQWVLKYLRDTMKITTLAASDILSVKRLRGTETCKPVQLTMKSFEMKETVLNHRRFIKFSSIKIENFLQKDDMIKIGKLVKIAKTLRQAGHFSVVKDELLFVDHVLVNTSKSNLLRMFPYMPTNLFDDF